MNNGLIPLLGFPTADVVYGPPSTTNQFNLKAGATVQKNDLLELSPDGKCYPVQTTDYAAVNQVIYGTAQTNAATGQIVAQTQVVASQTEAKCRQAVVQGDDGSIFTFTANASGTQGLLLTKYSGAGALVSYVVLDATTAAYNNHQILKLQNGNIAIAAVTSTTTSYAVYSSNLTQITALTSVGELTQNFGFFSICALSAGGFAVVYQQNTNPLLSRLATYDNTGTVVQAPTTIWTRTGTTGVQYHRMAQLSNGDLAVAVQSQNTVASIGLYYGIVSTAGASVKAFASLDSTGSGNLIPELSVMAGYFAVSKPNSTNQLAFVFDNAGTLQGAGFTAATGVTTPLGTKLINDGTAFYLIWPRSSDSKEVLTKLPVTGAGYVTTAIAATGAAGLTNYNAYIDAFCENGLIVGVVVSSASNSQHSFFVVSLASSSLISASLTGFGSAPGTPEGKYPRAIAGGDFSFICLYDFGAGATNLYVGKYANTAVMGVAQAAAAADALVPVAGIAGGYAANYIKGSASKAFDHLTTNINGNKGTLMNNGTVLKGF